jgi:hypothetical protein
MFFFLKTLHSKFTVMKKLFFFFICTLFAVPCISQQTGPVLLKSKKTTLSKKSITKANVDGKEILTEATEETTQKEESPILILYGIGNFNQESFSTLNSSGKASFLFIPLDTDKKSLRISMSVNKNATNNDSLLASTLLFPEIGNHSFLGTLEWMKKVQNKGDFKTDVLLSGFFEFAYKKIKIDQTDTILKTSLAKSFATVNFTIGGKLTFAFEKADMTGSFSLVPYISYFNIPDEDRDDYRYLAKKNFRFINNNDLRDDFFSIGIKTIFEINSFQLFADFRHVLRNDKVSVVELRGLKANIGVVFNANILSARL